jgi:hypothetical protein
MQRIGFFIILIVRMVVVSAEIIYHRSRAQDMETRTPQSELKYIV